MIGSHDSLTCFKSTSWVYNNCKKWWKTQNRSIEDQYAFGIRLFDIRVKRDGKKWRGCHGLCDLKVTFGDLEDVCREMTDKCPEALYRIVLEKGDSRAEVEFARQASRLCARYPNLWRADVKRTKKWTGTIANNNQSLFDAGYAFALVNTWEEPARELHGTVTTSNFCKTDLRKEAKKINSGLGIFKDGETLKEALLSKDRLWLIDYCTDEY